MGQARKPRTLVKTAAFNGELAEALQKSLLPLRPVEFSLGNVNKFLAYEVNEQPYLLIVAQQKDKVLAPAGYNVTFSVTSYSDDRNQSLSHKFSRETGISFNITPPRSLVELISKTDIVFPLFLGDPSGVLKIWGAER
jgi:hypothetical protein